MFLHRNIHTSKCTWTSSDGKTHKEIVHLLIDRSWLSSIIDVQSFRGADCDTEHYLAVAKVRERLVVSKQRAQKFDGERFTLRQLSEMEARKKYQIKISKQSAALENLNDSNNINRVLENNK
jgi:hypothetical protein